MNTKERITHEALKLFSQNGYNGTSVKQIADAVGIKDASLYKHFKSKQEIFESIVEMSTKSFSSRMGKFGVDFAQNKDDRAAFFKISHEEQVDVMQRLFLHTLGDKSPALFRKMMTVEQFKQPRLAELYNQRYVDAQYDAFEALMQDGINMGVYKPGNARAMAMQYVSPIIILVGVCDRAPERKEESLKLIADHIRQFDRNYRNKKVK